MNDEPPKLSNFIDCRRLAFEIWSHKVIIEGDISFTPDRLVELVIVNDMRYYDVYPGSKKIREWFLQFKEGVS